MKIQLLENKLSMLLILLGLMGPIGYFFNIKALRGLGTAGPDHDRGQHRRLDCRHHPDQHRPAPDHRAKDAATSGG